MIGAFDSGIGGLTVVKAIWQLLPNAPLIYFGDTARTPYGDKSAEVISQFGVENAEFLVNKGASVLVVACNTVSAVGMEAIKQRFPNLPIFEVITPAIERVRGLSKSKRVGIIGTRALVNSQIYPKLLKQAGNYQVFQQAAPLLVPLVEENWLDKPETKRIIKGYLRPLKQQQVDTLVLACTHYPLLKKIIIPRVGRQVKVVDPADEVALKLKEYLSVNGQEYLGEGASHFYVSDLTPHFQDIAQKWLGKKINLEKVKLS